MKWINIIIFLIFIQSCKQESFSDFYVHIYENKSSYYTLSSDSLILEKKILESGEVLKEGVRFHNSQKKMLQKNISKTNYFDLYNCYFHRGIHHPKAYVFTISIKGKEKVIQTQHYYVSELGELAGFINSILKNQDERLKMYYPEPRKDNSWVSIETDPRVQRGLTPCTWKGIDY